MLTVELSICDTGAVFYYYTYKRTALRLSDPRFYQINDWIIAEFEKKL